MAIKAMARHTSGVQIGGTGTVEAEAAALTRPPFEVVVHMAEDHQRHRTLAADAIDRQSQILIPPIAGWGLPVATAGVGRVAAEACWTAMGQEHQRQS